MQGALNKKDEDQNEIRAFVAYMHTAVSDLRDSISRIQSKDALSTDFVVTTNLELKHIKERMDKHSYEIKQSFDKQSRENGRIYDELKTIVTNSNDTNVKLIEKINSVGQESTIQKVKLSMLMSLLGIIGGGVGSLLFKLLTSQFTI